MESEIPTVDLEAGEDEVVQQLKEACMGHGFFYLKGHGIPQEQMDSVLACSESFFKQSDEFKLRVGPGSPGPKFRGYSPWRAIALDPKRQQGGDTREQFSIGVEAESDSESAKQWPTVLGPNKWPDSLPGNFDGDAFRTTMRSYYAATEALGMRMLPLLSRSLGGAPDALAPLFRPPLVTMNLNHYAATPSEPAAGILGCGAHTDYGVLTFLLTDSTPGLQICRGRDKGAADALEFQLADPDALRWLAVPPPGGGRLIVNTGDMLERLSNGMYRSNLHRVVTARPARERLSVAVFFEPALPALIQPLPCCLAGGGGGAPAEPKYAPVVSGQFLLNKYAATGEDAAGPTA